MNLLPLIKPLGGKGAKEVGVATEANRKKNKVRDRVKGQTGRSPSSPVHDHLDQFCKRDETEAVSVTVGRVIRDPLQLQQAVQRPVLHLQGGRRCVWKQIPNILPLNAPPDRKKH